MILLLCLTFPAPIRGAGDFLSCNMSISDSDLNAKCHRNFEFLMNYYLFIANQTNDLILILK